MVDKKHVGILLLGVWCVFSGAGSCPEGAFPCANSSLCIPQYSVCNKHIDCPLADDEDITCGRYEITIDQF